MLLGGHAKLILRCGLGEFGLRPLCGLGGVLPHLPLDEPHPFPASGFRCQLGAVAALDTDIFVLVLINLAMYISVDAPSGGPQDAPNRALGLEGLLLCQLAVGLI